MTLTRTIGAFDDGTPLVPGIGTMPIDVRKSMSALWASAGVVAGGPSPLVTGTTGFAYSVAGPVPLVTTRGPSDGFAMFTNDGATSVTCPGAPGSGLQRIDIVWVRHPTNTENGDTSSAPIFGVKSGLAASTALPPTIPAGALELGRNLMLSTATSTASTGNTITQTALFTALRGTPVNVRSAAERDAYAALVGLYDGLSVYRLDLHLLETYNGTAWVRDYVSNTQTLFFPGVSTYDTPASGTSNWLPLGNVTVPTWATQCHVTYSVNGFFPLSAGLNCSAVIKIGSAAGAVSRRIINDVANDRRNFTVSDKVTGLSAGVAAVTLSATYVGGTVTVYRFDTNSYATATFTFQP